MNPSEDGGRRNFLPSPKVVPHRKNAAEWVMWAVMWAALWPVVLAARARGRRGSGKLD